MKKLILILSAMCLISCAEDEDEVSVTDSTAIANAASTSFSAMADEQVGATMARLDKSLMDFILPKAFAAACQRPFYATCNAGVRSTTFDACDVFGGTLSGSATLTYTDNGCDLSTSGDAVTRTYDLEVTGPLNGVIKLSSDGAADYKNDNYDGGGRLERTGSGWELDILGKHHSFVGPRGVEIYNVSVRTLSAIGITGGLSRASRVMDGGQLEVNHNRAGFTALIVPSNLRWTANCCHPTSGSLAITYSGSKTGSATVTYGSCGTASITSGSETENLTLSYCE